MNLKTMAKWRFFVLALSASVLVANAAQVPVIDGLALWLDASQLTGLVDGDQVNTWTDMSGMGNNALRQGGSSAGYPKYVASGVNGVPVIRFNSGNSNTGDYFKFNSIANIRSVFWVIKENAGLSDGHFLLGGSGSYDFHRKSANGPIWDSGYAHPNIRGGTTKLMGTAINGTETSLPSDSFQLVSLVTSGDVQADQVTQDRTFHGSWQGDIAEILIYNRALTGEEELAVGGYLAGKYGLNTAYSVTPEAKITGFSLLGSPGVIDGTNIVCTVPYSTVLTALTPTYGTSAQATGVPASGVVQDFTDPVTYTVVSSDLLVTNLYSVTVVKAAARPEKDILTFGGAPGLPGVISGNNISWTVPWGTDIAHLAPNYTVSAFAVGSPASGVANDFTAPATYTVTAEDGSTKDYTVTVTVCDGLQVKTYDTTANASYLNPIANLMALTPSGITTQATDIAYSGNFYSSFPGLTSGDNFSILWEGWFDVAKAGGPGAYTFGLYSDDNSVIYLDLNGDGDFADAGELIVSQNNSTGIGTVLLNMSAVRIAIGFYQGGGGSLIYAKFKKGAGVAYASLDPVNSLSGYFSSSQPASSLSAATLWNFGLPGNPAVVNGNNLTLNFAHGMDVTQLTPVFAMNFGSTCTPASGSTNDFTDPVVYTVVSADTTATNVYIVTAKVLPENPVLHVDTVARGTGDGLSWANATTLTNALIAAIPLIGLDQIWIAEGVYANPNGMDFSGEHKYGFLADKSVFLYGGFTNGMANLAERDWVAHPAILDGGGVCGVFSIKASNVRLDGVTLKGGQAEYGGGIYKPSGYTNLVVANCRLTGNKVAGSPAVAWGGAGYGGGAYLNGGAVTLTNCWFENPNDSYARHSVGNAIFAPVADLTIVDCTFTNNTGGYSARDGRAVCLVVDGGTLSVRNSYFVNNRYSQGGGGGAANLNNNLNAVFENCRFKGNGGAADSSGPGAVFYMNINTGYTVTVDRCAFVANTVAKNDLNAGAIYKQNNGGLNIANCTFHTNTVMGTGKGGAVYANGGAVKIHNSILWNNVAPGGGSEIYLNAGTVNVSYSDLTGTNGTYVVAATGAVTFDHVISADPLFAGGLDVHLQAQGGRWNPATKTWVTDAVNSPCIDTGDPASAYALEPQNSNNKRVNMGAYGNTPQASYVKPWPNGTVIIVK